MFLTRTFVTKMPHVLGSNQNFASVNNCWYSINSAWKSSRSEDGSHLAHKQIEVSVLTGATRRNIAENAILHSHRRENLRSYTDTEGSSC
jgi:hypothetical protein